MALLAKALGHPARIAIIEYLMRVNTCICGDIVNELPLAQATISQHLRELKNEPDGKQKSNPSFTYETESGLQQKIEAVAKKIYHAGSVSFAGKSKAVIKQLEQDGYAQYPICIAKTQYSFSDNAKSLGAPEGYELTIRDIRLSAGAGFVVAFAGDIIAMPGLPKHPAAIDIDVDENGKISGIF